MKVFGFSAAAGGSETFALPFSQHGPALLAAPAAAVSSLKAAAAGCGVFNGSPVAEAAWHRRHQLAAFFSLCTCAS